MFNCIICGRPTHWDAYWDAWVHSEPNLFTKDFKPHAAETAAWSA